MPSSSMAMTRKTPSSTSPQGSLRLRMPLMTVAMSRACGAAAFSLPIPWIHCTSILCVCRVVEIFAVGQLVRAERVQQRVLACLALVGGLVWRE